MKKIFLSIAVLFVFSICANAQFVAGAGYCNSSVQEKLAAVESDRVSKHGIFVEAGYDIGVNRYVSILPMVQLANYFGSGNHYYAKVPVFGKVIFASDMDLKLFLYLGPEFYCRLAENSSEGFDFSYNDTRYNRFNLFVAGGAGADIYNHLRIKVGYERDVLNEYIEDYNGNLMSHTADFIVGVSYLF